MNVDFFKIINSNLIPVYLAQIVQAIIFFTIFYYFGRVYKKSYLVKWSISWLGFFTYNLGVGYATILGVISTDNTVYIPKLMPSIIYLSGGMIQILFLLLGTYELVRRNTIKKHRVFVFIGVALTIALLMALLFAFDPTKALYRYFIRIGLRAFFASIAFISCGILTFTAKEFGANSFGKRLLGVAFILYGLELSQYFITVISNAIGVTNRGAYYYLGILDLLLIFIMGLGMVIWLLENERNQLKKINSHLDGFIYSTSHDLRAPIASVLGLTNIAKHDIKEEVSLSYINMIEERVNKLDHTINDILRFSKNSKLETKPIYIDFNMVLQEIKSDIQFYQKSKMIDFLYDFETPKMIYADAYQLKTILQNLLSNAVQYHDETKENPFIKATIEENSTQYKITIQDNGQGIRKQEQEKVFNMFYRGNYDSEGSGLGLFIVKEALNKLNGTMTMKSDFRIGTTFRIFLPKG